MWFKKKKDGDENVEQPPPAPNAPPSDAAAVTIPETIFAEANTKTGDLSPIQEELPVAEISSSVSEPTPSPAAQPSSSTEEGRQTSENILSDSVSSEPAIANISQEQVSPSSLSAPPEASSLSAPLTGEEEGVTRRIAMDAKTRNNLAVRKKKKGQVQEALAEYDKAIAQSPDYGKLYYNRAILHTEQGRLEQALSDYHKALELDPRDADSYSNRANVYVQLERWEEALAGYKQSLQYAPCAAEIYYNRGILHARLNHREEALSDLKRAVEFNGDLALAHYNLACLAALEGNVDEVLLKVEDALRKGYVNFSQLQNDPDLKSVQQMPKFQELLEKWETA